MEKGLEFFDACVTLQKEFLDSWTESTKKLQESFVYLGSAQESSAKETINIFNSLFNTVANSTKIFSDEAVKIQETCKSAVEKQMESGREIVNNFAQFFKLASEKK